jgi:hypothetical protein
MGVGLSSPVDDHTQREIEDLIKAILATFTVEYTKATVVGVVNEEAKALRKAPSPFKLLKRPRDYKESKEPRKTGWLVKQGGVVKNMKKRFFVVKRNWNVDYYEKEEDFEKGKKPKGTMSLAGYTVNDDPNGGLLQRAKKLAEQMGVDMSELPKIKEWPEEAIEIHHPRRRTWYIVCKDKADKKEWVQQFSSCCRYSYGLNNQEVVHKRAFDHAVRETRWDLGRWGWYSWGGSEEVILADLIADQIDYAVMHKIYGKITGPWVVRSKVRDTVLKTLNTTVSAACNPAWAACEEAIKVLRGKIDPVIHDNIGEVVKQEDDIALKIKEGALGIINPILAEHVTPHLAKIAEIAKSPVVEAFDKAIEIFIEETSKLDIKGSTKEEVQRSLYPLSWYTWGWTIWPALEKFDPMYEPLQAMSNVFPDLYAWSLIWDARDKLRQRADSAVYTFEFRLMATIDANPTLLNDGAALKAAAEKVREGIIEDFKYDATIASRQFWLRIMRAIVMPPFKKLVIPACKTLIDPIADIIPDLMKQIINPHKTFERLLNEIINSAIMTVIGEN